MGTAGRQFVEEHHDVRRQVDALRAADHRDLSGPLVAQDGLRPWS
jgi:hypothetical protein